MRTKNFLDIDYVIEYRREALHNAANELERRLSEELLAEAIAERDAAIDEWRASPEWDKIPF